MTINHNTITHLIKLVGARECSDIVRMAKRVDKLESRWKTEVVAYIEDFTKEWLRNAEETGRLRLDFVDFVPFVMEHSREITQEGIKSTERANPVRAHRLAKVPKAIQRKSFAELREWWDAYRKRHKIPERQAAIAAKLRKAYVEKCQEVWKANAQDFLSGITASKTEAVQAIMKGAGVVASRGKMIVETETTHYFNEARRKVYDESPDVTHYLFVAVRDHATTKWCKSRQGLVYSKGDNLLDKETPPIHWNCRSELLPLTPANPNHLRLIEEKGRRRRNNSPEPLPREWTARVR